MSDLWFANRLYTWYPVTWQNGWSDRGGAYAASSYHATPDFDLALVINAAVGTWSDGVTIFALPQGWWPDHSFIVPACTSSNTLVRVYVQGTADGNPGWVQVYGVTGTAPSYVQTTFRVPLNLTAAATAATDTTTADTASSDTTSTDTTGTAGS